MPGPAPEFRAGFRTKLLSQCHPAQRAEYCAMLEQGVRDSALQVVPRLGWLDTHVDTLLIFRDGKLVAGLCLERRAFVEPLVIVGDLGPLPARTLDQARLVAEGVLQTQNFSEYFFTLAPNNPASWLRILSQMGGTESLTEDGTEVLYRKIQP